ncbi:MAG: DUF2634 domain-containing protein [Selenomonadaceae bacterium]|nr:DUF2634 domain-containing protein [Selenomonadaceae bacterium]MBQ3433672.1 DUF2634 domain-containing protein [Selenomonadaceae bacterium]
MSSLYPTINLPKLVAPTSRATVRTNRVAPFFNFKFGEFEFIPNGKPRMATPKETFEQWCIKAVYTERGSRLAYSDKIGTEFAALAGVNDNERVKSSIIRTITESLMVHPQCAWVKNFSFRSVGDNLWVTFDVQGKEFDTPSHLEVRV